MNSTEDAKKSDNTSNFPPHQSTNEEKAERLKEDVLDEDETPSYAFGLTLTGAIAAILLAIAALYYGTFSP